MNDLHLISVRETSSTVVTAVGAQLTARIAGQSFFTGAEAFKKAAEVASLVSALKEVGLSEDDIRLLSVSSEVESGLLTKSSSATYQILIDCRSTELLGRMLTAVSSQKNSKILSVAWQYAELDQIKRQLILTAVRSAKDAAMAMAASLEVPLLGVHKLSYDVSGLDTNIRVPDESGLAMRVKARSTASLDSLSLTHTATVMATVNAEFVVDGFAKVSVA
ncbi:hypothetical protein Pla175_02330 [Pirellulimonas nuda]|uniref:SIMPL domain-containing protein n=1 Tax=Pirellulimonas nuda TaxID=2528009 RepID=A0A518D5Y8_9BACT|nr:SIMPL domain-containing protein [Pirellulimonas nuda]QDU86879.1 hypothetical protein Pla175_02330 [Pirellulimonas nuda]